ncbi:hypothetical protein HF086_005703 [Spodoptera exigua]|uniref:Phorbol-ester/DAG-type domain-containing protein n=1 Tax=Spodoptera exigua TaxID=7107 RepID=A0A922MYA0_SPOEX|nr:hypothetical protein HF086_005703 [Spodoptera exigua]
MAKCGGCGKFMSLTEGAKCDKCKSSYHRQCVGIRDAVPIATPWHCPECKRNVPRDNRADAPVRGHAPPAMDESHLHLMDTSSSSNTADKTTQEFQINIRAELKLFKEEFLNTVRHEFQVMRHDLSEIRTAISNTNARLTNLEERVAVIETQKQAQLQPSGASDLDNIISQLRSDINDRDQELLANDIQISNLPEISGENPNNTVMLIASKMGIKMEPRDIVCAERVGGRRITAVQSSAPVVTRPRFLIVRLARRDLRDQLLEGARARRGMTSADLDIPGLAKRFYINERLTKPNRELFRKAREAGSHHGWQFIWFKRGRVLARNKPGDSTCVIRCESDIQRVFGPVPVTGGDNTL